MGNEREIAAQRTLLKTEPTRMNRVDGRHRRGCHAVFYRTDCGSAAAVLRRLRVRLDADVERGQWPGRPDQSHHRELGCRVGRLERAEEPRASGLDQDFVEVVAA